MSSLMATFRQIATSHQFGRKRGKADIRMVGFGNRNGAPDPRADMGRIEMPQRSTFPRCAILEKQWQR